MSTCGPQAFTAILYNGHLSMLSSDLTMAYCLDNCYCLFILTQVVQVRIESLKHRRDDVTSNPDNDDDGEAEGDDVNVDIVTRAHSDSEPLLLVFSNDRHHRRFDSRELHEIIEREMELSESGDLPAAAVAGAGLSDYDDEYDDVDDYDADYYNRLDDEPENVVGRVERDTAAVSDARPPTSDRRDLTTADQKSAETRIRVPRAKFRRRMRRNICRRKPMYVNFQDIHWDGWIIEPRGYQV